MKFEISYSHKIRLNLHQISCLTLLKGSSGPHNGPTSDPASMFCHDDFIIYGAIRLSAPQDSSNVKPDVFPHVCSGMNIFHPVTAKVFS